MEILMKIMDKWEIGPETYWWGFHPIGWLILTFIGAGVAFGFIFG